MKHYFIIGSIFIVLAIGSLFLFTKRTAEIETVHYSITEIDEALKALEFDIKLPSYLPREMTMKEATISLVDKKQIMIGFRYSNPENTYSYEFSATKSNESLKDIASNNQYWRWTEAEVNEDKALIGINEKTMDLNIVFRNEKILYRFYTKKIEESTLLKIAASLE